MKIAVFCSANDTIAPEYFTLTEQLGKWMAEQGHSLVFGGCNLGLMECVAKAVHEGGGQTIGVVPSIIEERGRVSDYVDVEIPCDNLSDRKQLMLAKSDVSIALPGGVGTLDEIFSVVAAQHWLPSTTSNSLQHQWLLGFAGGTFGRPNGQRCNKGRLSSANQGGPFVGGTQAIRRVMNGIQPLSYRE